MTEENNIEVENVENNIVNDEVETEVIEENKVDDLNEKIKQIEDENTKLSNEVEALKDKLLRLGAEYENYRKRTTKEKEGIYSDSVVDVLKETLPILDNLERALTVGGSYEDFKVGVEMTSKQFIDTLSKFGVEEISIENGFDPNIHNAVMHINDDSFGENEIVEVFQKGYKKGEKVLRHSMVKVAN
ncbi:MAG: nucleotide exchange factor GrpE [Clostridiaceae bacterium]